MEADAGRPAALRCSSCDAPIVWALDWRGKRIPLDAEPVQVVAQGHYAIEWPSEPYTPPRAMHRPAIHLTHFATCPNAASHRRK